MSVCLLQCCRVHRDLHSFPTRRSSDLSLSFTEFGGRGEGGNEHHHHRARPEVQVDGCRADQVTQKSQEQTSELHSRIGLLRRPMIEKNTYITRLSLPRFPATITSPLRQ